MERIREDSLDSNGSQLSYLEVQANRSFQGGKLGEDLVEQEDISKKNPSKFNSFITE